MKYRLFYTCILIFFVAASTVFSADEKTKSSKDKLNVQTSDVPTVITCDGPMDVSFDKNIAVFRDNVVVKDQKGDVYADIMKVYFKNETKDISRIEADGNVIIYMEKKIAKSDKAVYNVDVGSLVLTGNPRIQEDKNIYAAEKITIFQKNGKTEMKLEPKAKLLLYRQGDDKGGVLF